MNIKKYIAAPFDENTYLIYDDKSGFVVDPGEFTNQMEKDIKENNIKISHILLTHGHGDHIGGVSGIKKVFPDVKVVIHKDDVELLENSNLNYSEGIFGMPITVKPDIEVNDGEVISIGDFKVNVIHTPGHTRGGVCYHIGGVVFTGDTLFRLSVGRTDLYGGDNYQLILSIREKLFKLEPATVVYPGHENMTTIEYELKNNPYAV